MIIKREVIPRRTRIDSAAEVLAHRALEFVGFDERHDHDTQECDIAIRDLALQVYRALGKKPPRRAYRKKYVSIRVRVEAEATP